MTKILNNNNINNFIEYSFSWIFMNRSVKFISINITEKLMELCHKNIWFAFYFTDSFVSQTWKMFTKKLGIFIIFLFSHLITYHLPECVSLDLDHFTMFTKWFILVFSCIFRNALYTIYPNINLTLFILTFNNYI